MRKSRVPRDLTPIFRFRFSLDGPKSGEPKIWRARIGIRWSLHISAESERVFYINRNDDEMGVNSSAIQIVFDWFLLAILVWESHREDIGSPISDTLILGDGTIYRLSFYQRLDAIRNIQNPNDNRRITQWFGNVLAMWLQPYDMQQKQRILGIAANGVDKTINYGSVPQFPVSNPVSDH